MSKTTPKQSTPKFPRQREILLEMLEADQKELRRAGTYSTGTFKDCHKRAAKMLEILTRIKEPTIDNIGTDGSQAVTILTLHSYLDLMKMILNVYEKHFRENPESIYYQGIPSLKDRVMILGHRRQLFGTNWVATKDGALFLVKVEDFKRMNGRRKKYGLGPAKRPTNLQHGAMRHPLGRGLAHESDQKELDDDEYREYSCYVLAPLA